MSSKEEGPGDVHEDAISITVKPVQMLAAPGDAGAHSGCAVIELTINQPNISVLLLSLSLTHTLQGARRLEEVGEGFPPKQKKLEKNGYFS